MRNYDETKSSIRVYIVQICLVQAFFASSPSFLPFFLSLSFSPCFTDDRFHRMDHVCKTPPLSDAIKRTTTPDACTRAKELCFIFSLHAFSFSLHRVLQSTGINNPMDRGEACPSYARKTHFELCFALLLLLDQYNCLTYRGNMETQATKKSQNLW